MRTLEEISADLLYLLADDMDEDELARVSAMPTAERVRYCYLNGDCDVFALAVHRITGWPIVGVVSSSRGPLHRLVRAPDGKLLDAAGWVDEGELCRRYGLRRLVFSAEGGEERAASSLFGTDENGIDDQIADAVAAIRMLPWAPFSEHDFREMSLRPVEGADPSPASPRNR